jgi:hypothetical protein
MREQVHIPGLPQPQSLAAGKTHACRQSGFVILNRALLYLNLYVTVSLGPARQESCGFPSRALPAAMNYHLLWINPKDGNRTVAWERLN